MISRRNTGIWKDKKGAAIVEAAFLFPILLTLFFGMWDLGNGILMNQQTITASQVVGDLITREKSVSTTQLNNYIEAGRLAYGNAPTDQYGVDIASIRFDEDDEPELVWRETRNMTAPTDILTRADGLGTDGEGVLVVTVEYTYAPTFSALLTGDLVMQEQSFLRGRRTPVVERGS